MGKLSRYDGSIDLISGIRQKNGGTFALMEANAIMVDENDTRLDKKLEDIDRSINNIPNGNTATATKLAAARKFKISGGATAGEVSFDGSADVDLNVTALDGSKITGTIPSASIPSIDNSKITSVDGSKLTGTIPLGCIPKGAQERLYIVSNDDARLKLTSNDVQNGDVVKVSNTGLMYFVKDESKLDSTSSEDAFESFTAGSASSVDWSGISNKPAFATVATSGKYSDLSGTPTIPTVPGFCTSVPKEASGSGDPGEANTIARGDHTHPAQTSVSGNAGSATKLAVAKKFKISGGATAGEVSFDGSADVNLNVTALDGSKITGTIPLASIPRGALERLVIVDDENAMLALTTSDVQNGDVVKVESEQSMFYIKDDSKLGTMAAFEKFAVGEAASVSWTNIDGKPSFSNVATSGSYNDLSDIPIEFNTSLSVHVDDGDQLDIALPDDYMEIHGGNKVSVTIDPDSTNAIKIDVEETSKTFNATIKTGANYWTRANDAEPAIQIITVSGISSSDTPIVDIVPNESNYDNLIKQLEEYGNIYRITTGTNKIVVYSTEETTIDIPIQIKCVY